MEGIDHKEWLMPGGGVRKDPRGAESSTKEPDRWGVGWWKIGEENSR